MGEVSRAYRLLLRTVNRHITRVSGNTEFREYIRSEFRRGASASLSAQEVTARAELARDSANLTNDIIDHKELLLSYNIGIDPEQRSREGVKRAARLVGLALPVEEAEAK